MHHPELVNDTATLIHRARQRLAGLRAARARTANAPEHVPARPAWLDRLQQCVEEPRREAGAELQGRPAAEVVPPSVDRTVDAWAGALPPVAEPLAAPAAQVP